MGFLRFIGIQSFYMGVLLMNIKAVSIAGVEMYVQVLNPTEPEKKKWIIRTNFGKKISMNRDGKSFYSPEHGQDFKLLD